MELICAVVGALVIVAGGVSHHHEPQAHTEGCVASNTRRDSLSDESFRQTIITNVVAHERTSWKELELVVSDTADIIRVTDPNLCRTAVALIRASMRDHSNAPTEIRLVHIHKYFVAQSTLKSGEFQAIYIFDDPMTRLVYPSMQPKALPEGGGAPAGSRVGVVALYGNGDALLQVFVGLDAQPPRWQKILDPRSSAFFRVRPDGTIRALVGSVPVRGKYCYQDGPNGPISIPACSSPSWGLSSDGGRFVIVSPGLTGPDRATLLVTALGPMGDTLFSRRVPFAPHLIDAAAADSIHEAEAAKFRTPEGAAAARRLVLPPMFPPVDFVVVGRGGVTWIGLTPGGAVRQWICLDAQGVPTAFTNLPRRVRVRFADQLTLWGTVEDDDGIESVVRCRLH